MATRFSSGKNSIGSSNFLCVLHKLRQKRSRIHRGGRRILDQKEICYFESEI